MRLVLFVSFCDKKKQRDGWKFDKYRMCVFNMNHTWTKPWPLLIQTESIFIVIGTIFYIYVPICMDLISFDHSSCKMYLLYSKLNNSVVHKSQYRDGILFENNFLALNIQTKRESNVSSKNFYFNCVWSFLLYNNAYSLIFCLI